jgi:hypothetical protein
MSLGKFKLGYGSEIRFQKDIWLVAHPLDVVPLNVSRCSSPKCFLQKGYSGN